MRMQLGQPRHQDGAAEAVVCIATGFPALLPAGLYSGRQTAPGQQVHTGGQLFADHRGAPDRRRMWARCTRAGTIFSDIWFSRGFARRFAWIILAFPVIEPIGLVLLAGRIGGLATLLWLAASALAGMWILRNQRLGCC